jgi:hypothetical protein
MTDPRKEDTEGAHVTRFACVSIPTVTNTRIDTGPVKWLTIIVDFRTLRLSPLRNEEATDDRRPFFGNKYAGLIPEPIFLRTNQRRELECLQHPSYHEPPQGSADIQSLVQFHNTGR